LKGGKKEGKVSVFKPPRKEKRRKRKEIILLGPALLPCVRGTEGGGRKKKGGRKCQWV